MLKIIIYFLNIKFHKWSWLTNILPITNHRSLNLTRLVLLLPYNNSLTIIKTNLFYLNLLLYSRLFIILCPRFSRALLIKSTSRIIYHNSNSISSSKVRIRIYRIINWNQPLVPNQILDLSKQIVVLLVPILTWSKLLLEIQPRITRTLMGFKILVR